MKIRGKVPGKRPNEFIVIPRPEGGVPFEARPLESFDEFYALVPLPQPPAKMTKEGKVEDYEAPGYREQLHQYNTMQSDYMIIVSLEPSEIEWDSVKIDAPKTWKHWRKDLKNAGFTLAEINIIFQLACDANSLSEVRLREARESFIRGQAEAQASSSGQNTELPSSPSGPPAQD